MKQKVLMKKHRFGVAHDWWVQINQQLCNQNTSHRKRILKQCDKCLELEGIVLSSLVLNRWYVHFSNIFDLVNKPYTQRRCWWFDSWFRGDVARRFPLQLWSGMHET